MEKNKNTNKKPEEKLSHSPMPFFSATNLIGEIDIRAEKRKKELGYTNSITDNHRLK